MILDLGSLYSLHCRAYDEGVAYRMESKISGSITVRTEIAEFNFKDNPQVWIAYDEDKRTMSQWELPYKRELSVKSIKTGDYGINPCFSEIIRKQSESRLSSPTWKITRVCTY